MVRNELMGSTEKGMFESQNTDPWCGSRAAGWRVAAEKMTTLMRVPSWLASDASLVLLAWMWNAMVPRLEMVTTLRKLDTNATLVTVVSALAVLLKQLNLKALKASDDGATSIAQMATMASMASTEMVAPMESKETLMASMVSEAPMAMLDLASLALMAARVLGDRSKQEKTALRDVEIFTLENLDMLFEETGLGC